MPGRLNHPPGTPKLGGMTSPSAPPSEPIRVAVLGASGKMGRHAVEAVGGASDLELVAELGSRDPLSRIVDAGATHVLDLTVPKVSPDNVAFAVEHGLHTVVGTSGWSEDRRAALQDQLAQHPDVGVLIAPNFSVGSVLASAFAAKAARLFPSVEIIEMHHPDKVDAPSGTAVRTARLVAAARRAAGLPDSPDATTDALPGARGADVEGVPVHAVRLTGLVAHQEVLMGAAGETLTLRHDSYDRASFMPGVLLAVREIRRRPGLTVGIESFLGL
jgi:4-hydroxy-tetrahydrodipicolinate reductase